MTDLFSHYPKATLERFKKFHTQNPHVYAEFKSMAFDMKARGRKRYSAETIINVIRWHRDMGTTGDVFEINNDFKSIYVRLLIYHHPEFHDFFELRTHTPKGIKSHEQQRREAELSSPLA